MNYVTSYEACKLLGISRTYLKTLVDKKRIRVKEHNAGLHRKSLMYLEDDVIALHLERLGDGWGIIPTKES